MSFQKLIVISDEVIKSSDSSFFSLHHFKEERGREREAIIRRTKNYEKIEKIVKRYRGTAFVKNAEIMTRSKFIGKFNIVVE